MPWYYKITDAENYSLYDHNKSHITTLMGSDTRVPQDLQKAVVDEVLSRGVSTLSDWQKTAMIVAAGEDFQQDQGL